VVAIGLLGEPKAPVVYPRKVFPRIDKVKRRCHNWDISLHLGDKRLIRQRTQRIMKMPLMSFFPINNDLKFYSVYLMHAGDVFYNLECHPIATTLQKI
jgi:hypothetical protein